MEKERDAELARLEAEKEMLQKMKDEELRELKLSMLQQQRDREEALKRELEEREAQVIMWLWIMIYDIVVWMMIDDDDEIVAYDERGVRDVERGARSRYR